MDNNSKSGNNFFSGFLLGALVGAAMVFLLGTKKGKKILKTISEEGIDNIANILNEVNETEDLDEIMEDDSSFSEVSADKSAGTIKSQVKEEIINGVKPKIKRLFRGISKRVN